ncbi:hypothetical protein [Halobellus sp. Atlit-38R]|uniref:hypothetical protein n=1 Tax=Halobellus sp. Atlit-38R TaxID=2282131 RepID=UPI0011C48A3E|nr:hypothetical protein [Halobellus sp. Atlit-38R]
MECPRCGTTLTSYTRPEGEFVAVVCEQCGFANIPASHHGESIAEESWEHAIDRFQNTIGPVLSDADPQIRTKSVDVPDTQLASMDEVSLEATGVAVGTVINSTGTASETAAESDSDPEPNPKSALSSERNANSTGSVDSSGASSESPDDEGAQSGSVDGRAETETNTETNT